MEERLITVTDEKGTVLRPIDATFEVDYKYEGETTTQRVLEGDVSRGKVRGTEFPAPTAGKDLEYSEVRVNVKNEPKGWNAYSSKTRIFEGKIPQRDTAFDGVNMKLPFIGEIPKTKEEKRAKMAEKRDSLLEALQKRFPPKPTQVD